ncbi:MAG: SIR2 family protein [Planctomycetota bacterium]
MKTIQDRVRRDTVTIVGSGLSCAEGLPGMAALEKHLRDNVKPAEERDEGAWEQVLRDLKKNVGLEKALDQIADRPSLVETSVQLTASFIREAERLALNEVLAGKRKLKFGELVPHIATSGTTHIVTTNYDRLVEAALELAGVFVDCGCPGSFISSHDFSKSALEQFVLGRSTIKASEVKGQMRHHAVVYKPHGSLDWLRLDGVPKRVAFDHDMMPLMITPGAHKYREGYERPFEEHRTRANIVIKRASSLMFLGYGFNDDHLEVEIRDSFRRSVPAIVLARTLSSNAKLLLATNSAAIALEAGKVDEVEGTNFHKSGSVEFLAGKHWWDVEALVNEVMK